MRSTTEDELDAPPASPRQSRSMPDDRPPVGEPLVASRRPRARSPHEPRNGDSLAASAADAPAVPEPPPFAGRSVLVTGATSELGTAFAASFAEAGAEIHLLDDDLIRLREVAAELPGASRALVLCCDLGSVEQIRSVGDFLERAEAAPDIVVHAAQVREPGTALGSPIEDLDEHYLIGVRGPTVLLQAIVPQLSPGSTVVFADRAIDLDPVDAHGAVVDAARMRLIDALRSELDGRGVTVMTARWTADTPPAEVAGRVVSAMATDEHSEVLEVTLRARTVAGEAPEG